MLFRQSDLIFIYIIYQFEYLNINLLLWLSQQICQTPDPIYVLYTMALILKYFQFQGKAKI